MYLNLVCQGMVIWNLQSTGNYQECEHTETALYKGRHSPLPSGVSLWLHLKQYALGKPKVGHALPALHSFLQFLQEIPVELIQLRQVVQDLVKEPVLNHGLPELPGCMGYGTPEILLQSGGQKSLFIHTTWSKALCLDMLYPLKTYNPKLTYLSIIQRSI